MYENKKGLKTSHYVGTTGLYIGTFDPFTKGHESIVSQALNIFDNVAIIIVDNPLKGIPVFTQYDRLNMIAKIYRDIPNIFQAECRTHSEIADMFKIFNSNSVIRGIRNESDYTYEVKVKRFYENLYEVGLNFVYFLADIKHQHISSSLAKERILSGECASEFLNESISDFAEREIRLFYGKEKSYEKETKKET